MQLVKKMFNLSLVSKSITSNYTISLSNTRQPMSSLNFEGDAHVRYYSL
jgi:hypothetical protein